MLHGNKHLFTAYPRAISQAMQTFLRVDDVDKRAKERRAASQFRAARGGWRHVLSDALKMARAWR
jgi:electron transfer flavoprotein-quinone oxidoreductase